MDTSNIVLDQEAQNACKFVEVLTTEISGEIVGHRFAGRQPGPNALVAGDAALIDAISQRLNGMDVLPWVRGNLYLVEIDGIELVDLDDVQSCLFDVRFDEVSPCPMRWLNPPAHTRYSAPIGPCCACVASWA